MRARLQWQDGRVEITAYLDALEQEGRLLAAAAGRAGLDAAVPSCPGWQVRDLLAHTGYVHRWAGRIVSGKLTAPPPDDDEARVLAAGPADGQLLDWFAAGHAELVAALRAAPAGLSCWSFLPAPSGLAFWARRQAHETAIHRADAQLAAGGPVTPPEPDFAADGIDELMTGFVARQQRRLSAGQAAAPRRLVRVEAADTGQAWQAELTDGGLAASVQRVSGAARAAADATATGPAAALYLALWNRAEPGPASGVAVDGDAELFRAWAAGRQVTW